MKKCSTSGQQYLKPEAEIRKIKVRQGQPRLKIHKTPSQPMVRCGGMYLSLQLYERNTSRRMVVQASPSIKIYLKNS
jgi:hypothetical protein